MNMHEGHRKRMRNRFRKDGLVGFAPHEVLELLLFYARARGDVNPLAHRLLEVFGSLRGVLEAPPEQLMQVEGIGEETATFLGLMVPVFRKYQESMDAKPLYLTRRVEAERYCHALLVGLRFERLQLISLSAARMVIGTRVVGEGGVSEVHAYPRHVVEAALNHNACSVILCHNHPGGTPEPSEADLLVTRQIEAVLRHLGIRLMDHIIVAGNKTYSMSLNGQIAGTGVQTRTASGMCREEEQEYVWLDEGELDT